MRDNDYRPRLGGKVGAVVDIPLTKHLSIQPGLFFSMKGANHNYYMGSISGSFAYFTSKTTLSYLELPVNVTYKFRSDNKGFFVFTGPYMSYLLSNKTRYESEGRTLSEEDVQGAGGNRYPLGTIETMEAGVNAGFGYMLPQGVYFRLQGSQGLVNFEGKSNRDNYLRNAGIGLSVGFRLGKK